MNASQLSEMKKLEVIVGSEHVRSVETLFEHAGISGFTALAAVSGLGHDGYHAAGLTFNDEAGLTLLMAVVSEVRCDAVVEGLREFFESRSGVFFVSAVAVSRPEYFA